MPKPDDKLSDAELVRAVRVGGRTEAYGLLVDRHLAGVYAAVLRIVGNRADAEDLAQDTFLRAYERLDLYDMRYSLRNWLLKIGTNLALNHVEVRRRERHRRQAAAEAAIGQPAAAGRNGNMPGPQQWRFWLEQLDPSQRAAIVLFHFCELPYAEIAEVLDAPVNTVRTYLHRGRRRLRELMTNHTPRENPRWTVAI